MEKRKIIRVNNKEVNDAMADANIPKLTSNIGDDIAMLMRADGYSHEKVQIIFTQNIRWLLIFMIFEYMLLYFSTWSYIIT